MPTGVYIRKAKSAKTNDHADKIRAGLRSRRIEEAMDAFAVSSTKYFEAAKEYREAKEALYKAMEL